ncbi:Levodione reductase [Pirellulimonas nuda]|uniref:Levodione reductase n=1 Tax=Pirellulimonas nuda TaxID=2528009 RepID=A0A518D8A8_9BACT|nr:SDR family oxidoreductase [Pirellulimonas nuda]QDU87694.1 Levodione reductase [Pirellulimonas nuda]
MAFDNAAYLIIGGAGGIGSEVAKRLTTAGAQILLAGRSVAPLEALARSISCESEQLDSTNLDAVEACASGAAERFGRLDGIINCAGSLLLKPAHLTSAEEWEQTLSTNLTTAFAAVRAAAKTMRKTGGSVVLFSSAAARLGLPNHEAIAAAKAGVAGLTLSAAATYASSNIRVNAVAPGLVKTPMTEQIWSRDTAAKASEDLHALGRLGEPADVASLVVWLLDPSNNWITGQVFSVDGGLSSVRTSPRRS